MKPKFDQFMDLFLAAASRTNLSWHQIVQAASDLSMPRVTYMVNNSIDPAIPGSDAIPYKVRELLAYLTGENAQKPFWFDSAPF